MADDYWKMRKAYAQMNGTAAREEQERMARQKRQEGAQAPPPKDDGLAAYRIFGTVTEVYRVGHESIVSGVSGAQAIVERATFQTREEAVRSQSALAQKVAIAITAAGGRIPDRWELAE